MSPEELFNKFLDKSQQGKAVKTVGLGTAKEIKDSSCTVFRDGQPELHDVRFHATEIKPGSRHVMIPADGSSVIYAIIENQDTEAVLLVCSEIERTIIEIGDTKYEIDAEAHLIAKGDNTLGAVLSAVIDEINKIVVITGRSPNVVALTDLKTKLNTILK